MMIVKAECGIRFRLREPKSKLPTPIICIIEYDGKPVIKIPTGVKVHPSKWNASSEKPIGGLKGLQKEDYDLITDRITKIKNEVNTQYKDYTNQYDRYPDKKEFKTSVMRALSGKEEEEQSTIEKDLSFINFISLQIKRSEAGARVKLSGNGKGHAFSKGTISDYRVGLNFLKKYLEDRAINSLHFDDVTLEFYWDLQDYVYNERKLSLNYFGKLIKNIKAFMREAQEMGYHSNEAYKSRRFLKPQEETDAIYLNVEQLKKIEDLNLIKTPFLENARDLFLLGCWTGLRFQDYSQLASKAKIEGNFIHIKTTKTGASVAIPLLPTVKNIIKKYEDSENGILPHAITNQKLNEYIKVVAEKAKLNQSINISIPVAGKRKTVSQPLHSLVTTHSARRSFATNMYRHFNLPPTTIMKVTGHKSESVFLKYIRMSPEENAQLILDAVNKFHDAEMKKDRLAQDKNGGSNGY